MKDIYRNEVAALSKKKITEITCCSNSLSDQLHLQRRVLDEHEITTHY